MRARRVPRPRGGRIFVGMTAMVFAGKTRPVYRRASPAAGKTRPVYQSAQLPAEKYGPLYRGDRPAAEKCCPLYRGTRPAVGKCGPLYRDARPAAEKISRVYAECRTRRPSVPHSAAWSALLVAAHGTDHRFSRRKTQKVVQPRAFLGIRVARCPRAATLVLVHKRDAAHESSSGSKNMFATPCGCDTCIIETPPLRLPCRRGGVFCWGFCRALCRALCRESSPGFPGSFAPSLSRGLCLHAQRRARQREKRRSRRR